MLKHLVQKPGSTKRIIKEYLLMAFGIFLVAIGNYFFKFPNNFSLGGVTGLSVLLAAYVPSISTTTFSSVINILFLAVGFVVLKRDFGIRTMYCTALFSGMLSLLELICPMTAPLTDERLLELTFSVVLPAIGTAIVFNLQGSTGGTDILALIIKKYSSMDIGKALFCSDVLIALAALFVFDIETGLLCVLGMIFKSVLIDNVAASLNRKKSLTIITDDPHIACTYINNKLTRGATFWKAEGAYTHNDKYIVLSVLSGAQAVALRRYLKVHDPKAFILVENSSEIFGNGFMQA